MSGLRTCASWFSVAVAIAAPGALYATDFRVPAGSVDNMPKVLTNVDTLTVDPTALLSSPTDPTVNQVGVANNVIVTNGGRIEAPNGRAFDTSGSGTPRTITINNVANAVIQGADDAIRINSDVGAGTVTVNNQGRIASIAGQGIDFDAIGSTGATVVINNFAGGVIQGLGDDAVRPGTATLNNVGTITSDGVAGSASDAVDTQARVATIVNFDGGVISGLRHGVAATAPSPSPTRPPPRSPGATAPASMPAGLRPSPISARSWAPPTASPAAASLSRTRPGAASSAISAAASSARATARSPISA